MPLTITINEAAPGTLTIGVGTPGVGVPAGGTAGQVLTKVNSTDYNTVFATPSADYITAVTAPLAVASGNLSVNLSTYLPLAGGTMDANATVDLSDTVTGTVSEVGGYGFAVSSSSNINLKTNVLFDRVLVAGAVGATTIKPTGVEFPDLTLQTSAGISAATASATYQTLAGMSSYLTTSSAASTYQTLAGMSSYLTTATAASTYYPLVGNPSGFLTSAPVTSVAGMTGAVLLANTDISGLGTMSTATAADYSTTVQADGLYYPLSGNPSAFLTDAPSDGSTYGRNNGAWVVAGGGGYITSVTSPLSVTSNDLSVDLSAYLPLAGGTMTGYLYNNPGTGMDSVMTEGNFKVRNTSTPTDFGELTAIALRIQNSVGSIVVGPDMITFPDATTQTTAGYPNSNPLGFVDSAGVAANYYPLTNPSGFIGDAPSDGTYYARQYGAWAAVVGDAPSDGTTYGRNNAAWVATASSPPYYNSVWAYGNWYSATVTNIFDTGTMMYYNVLTF